MPHPAQPTSPRHQQGAALLVFLLIGVIAGLSFILNRFSPRSTAVNNQATMQTLAMAKEAIIGWSASRATTPGMLPCPEDTSLIGNPNLEGNPQNNCGNLLQIGRLPWRTLKLPPLRDDSGELLWYALSPGFRTSPINANNLGQLAVDGVANSAVAIVFSPGGLLAGQSRTQPTAALPPDVGQYLDGTNGTGPFASNGASGFFNDRVTIITREDLFNAVNRRILAELRGDSLTGGLANYYSINGNNYPWAAADLAGVPLVSQLGTYLPHAVLTVDPTFSANAWFPLIRYNVSADRQQVTLTINTPTPMSCTIIPAQPICQ